MYADRCRYVEVYDPHGYTFFIACVSCKVEHAVTVPAPRLWAYRQGAHIQDAFPDLTPGERELMLTGMCDACFKARYADKEEFPFGEFQEGRQWTDPDYYDILES